MQYVKLNKTLLLIALVVSCLLVYYGVAYTLDRSEFASLFTLHAILFLLFYKLMVSYKKNIKLLVALSILFRLLFVVATPSLSQDFYRFIWDGRLILEGFNVYLFTPESFINAGQYPIAQAHQLYQGMGPLSSSNFTNYPPLNQLCFVIAGFIAGKSILGSIVVMRLLIILADMGTLIVGIKLLKKLKMPSHTIFWYILNPLVIIELTGNLHFESLMVFFLVLSLYLVHINQWETAAIVLALSISVKLIPLLFLPLLYQRLGIKKWIMFCGIIGLVFVLTFLPFLSREFIQNYLSTVGLWFQKFEFNASLYYLLRALGYAFRGFNEIAIIGPTLAIGILLFTLAMSVCKQNKHSLGLITTMVFVLSLYFLFATTVHPWYLATPLVLSVFTQYRFTVIWSFVVFLSYFAYSSAVFYENLWIVFVEYLIVYVVLLYELYAKKNRVTAQ
jgi:alpha-1,6-mannosyltransferase